MDVRGTGYVLTAFDLGFEIDLARAAERLRVGLTQESFRHKRGTIDQPWGARRPLRFARPIAPLILESPALGRLAFDGSVEVALYPFGAVSLCFALPLDLPLEGLVETSLVFYDNAELLGTARAEAESLLAGLGDAVRQPFLAPAREDYVIYSLQAREGMAARLETEERDLLARILRAERATLSLHEVANALDGRIAYGPEELVLVDWFGALLVGNDMEDERRVLELATVELVELRFLDGRLEQRLDEAYGLLTRSRKPYFGLAPRTRELERLARFQADSAILHESSDNALKLLGDDYLARLYDVCSERFHFGPWDTAIERSWPPWRASIRRSRISPRDAVPNSWSGSSSSCS